MSRIFIIVFFLLLGAGCGGVTAEGSVDADGCPMEFSDWSGTATGETCAYPPVAATIQIVNATTTAAPYNGRIDESYVSRRYDPATRTCYAYFVIQPIGGCDVGYTLAIPAVAQ